MNKGKLQKKKQLILNKEANNFISTVKKRLLSCPCLVWILRVILPDVSSKVSPKWKCLCFMSKNWPSLGSQIRYLLSLFVWKQLSKLTIKDSNVNDTLDNKRDEGKEDRFNTILNTKQVDVSQFHLFVYFKVLCFFFMNWLPELFFFWNIYSKYNFINHSA